MTGYSGTPLWKKLGYRPGMRAFTENAPDDYRALLDVLPDGVTFVDDLSQLCDLIHVFVTRRAELESGWDVWREALKPAGMLWISWPKKTARLDTDLTEDVLREVGLPRGLVDVKVCSVNAVWSGLKFVRRLTDRASSI